MRAFYSRAMEYALTNLTLNDAVLMNAMFINIPSRECVRFTQVEYFVSRYISICYLFTKIYVKYCRLKNLLSYHTPQELEKLSEEFSMYQLMQDNEIPQNVWDAALVKEDEEKSYYQMDILWNFLSTLKMPDSSLCFGRLSKVAKLILVLPHSNAEEERVFLMVRKNKTAFSPSLDPRAPCQVC